MEDIRPKISVTVILILMFLNLLIILQAPPAAAATDDQNLFGVIYKSDGTSLAEDPTNGNSTSYCIWVEFNNNWVRFPANGWELTSGGWYSYTIPESDKSTKWDHGSKYMVQVIGTNWGDQPLNCTSHGTGGVDVAGIPGQGTNEFTPEGTVYNVLNWADTSNPSTPDNSQRWDVQTPKLDLAPSNVTINGVKYPGPYPQPLIGPIVVDLNSTNNISAKVANLGGPSIIMTNTIIITDESNNDKVLSSEELQGIGAYSTAPDTAVKAQWKAPATSGDYYVNIAVDYYDNITETLEDNNYVKIIFAVKSIDLAPYNVMVDGTPYSGARPISLGATVKFTAQVKNAGTLDISDEFTLSIIDEGENILNQTDITGLGAGLVSTETVNAEWVGTNPGTYIFYIWIDLPANIIEEFDELNNIVPMTILVEGPDLVPWDVKVNGIPYKSMRTVSLGTTLSFAANAKNIGFLDVTETFRVRLVKDDDEVLSAIKLTELKIDEVSAETLVVEWEPTVLGLHNFNVTVDWPDDDITEFDEDNNVMHIEIMVVGTLTVDIFKVVDIARANPGDELHYTIYFNNTGDYTISFVKLNDTLPDGVTYVEDDADKDPAFLSREALGNLVTFVFNNLPPGSHSFVITVEINTSVIGGTVLENWVTMDYQDKDGNLIAGLIGYARTSVMAPRLQILKSCDNAVAGPNDILTYTIDFNNTGDANSATMRITDILPVGMTYVSDNSVNISSFSAKITNGSTLIFIFEEVEVGEFNFTITVKINANVTDNISLNNWAYLNYTDAAGNELQGLQANVSVNIESSAILILYWPSESEVTTNYKPLIALLFCLVLASFSMVIGYKRPLRFINRKLTDDELAKLSFDDRVKLLNFDRLFTCLVLALPVPLLEGIIGIVSYYNEFLKVPPWWGAGVIVNLGILIVGIILNVLVIWKGQSEYLEQEEDMI